MTTRTPLENHEEICAVRYKGINENLEKLMVKVDRMEKEMSLGRGAISAVAWLGGILLSISYLIISVLKLFGAKL